MDKQVFVTDGDLRATLAVVRALGSAGIPVTVGESRATSLAGQSRYGASTIRYPSPLLEPQSFQAFMRDLMSQGRYSVLLPMADVTMQLVAEEALALAPLVRVPFPPEDKVRLVQDKLETLALAEQCGIACPKTWVVAPHQQLQDLAATLTYPVVVKPRFSRFLNNGRWNFGTVGYARDSQELISTYRRVDAEIPFPLVQERLEGEGRGVFLLIWNGELKAAFCHRRLREKPPSGGVSVYCESLPLDESLVQQSFVLLQAIQWQGPAMVEFKMDPRDNRGKLMEVNGRFWGSLQLAIDAGMNFPLLLYRLATGEVVAPQLSYRVGAKNRWLLGDFGRLMMRAQSFWRGDPQAPLDSKSLLSECLEFCRFLESDLSYEDLRLEDLRPFLFACKSYTRKTLGRVQDSSARVWNLPFAKRNPA